MYLHFSFCCEKLRALSSQDFVFIWPFGIFHGASQPLMGNVWFCKLLLLFEIKSNPDICFKRHSCTFVSVMEEYYGQLQPGTLFNLHMMLRHFSLLRLLRLLSFLRFMSVLGSKLSFNEWSWQIVWPNSNQQLFMSCTNSLTYCMSYPPHQYWADWHLCQLVTQAPFCTPCARRPAHFLEQPVI